MRASGSNLVEVGTTNRTRLADYEAVLADAALVLKVHPSNYRIEGFAEEVGYRELAEAASRAGVPFVVDVGSGLLDTRVPWLDGPPPGWLSQEPGVVQTLDAGADLVLFSGDKLLGGPQAGIAVGRADLVAKLKKHPVARAVRLDGSTAAALTVTIEAYASGTAGRLPFWAMASIPYEALESRLENLRRAAGIGGEIVRSESVPGAGSVPGEAIPTPALKIETDADVAWKSLVAGDTPIVARRRDGALHIDLRTVDQDDDRVVAAALGALG